MSATAFESNRMTFDDAVEVGRTGLMTVNVLVEDRCPVGTERRRGARQVSPMKP